MVNVLNNTVTGSDKWGLLVLYGDLVLDNWIFSGNTGTPHIKKYIEHNPGGLGALRLTLRNCRSDVDLDTSTNMVDATVEFVNHGNGVASAHTFHHFQTFLCSGAATPAFTDPPDRSHQVRIWAAFAIYSCM